MSSSRYRAVSLSLHRCRVFAIVLLLGTVALSASIYVTGPEVLNNDAEQSAEENVLPNVASDGAGTWLAVWRLLKPSAEIEDQIRMARSTDGGATWSDPLTIGGVGDNGYEREQPWVASDGAGSWVVIWPDRG